MNFLFPNHPYTYKYNLLFGNSVLVIQCIWNDKSINVCYYEFPSPKSSTHNTYQLIVLEFFVCHPESLKSNRIQCDLRIPFSKHIPTCTHLNSWFGDRFVRCIRLSWNPTAFECLVGVHGPQSPNIQHNSALFGHSWFVIRCRWHRKYFSWYVWLSSSKTIQHITHNMYWFGSSLLVNRLLRTPKA